MIQLPEKIARLKLSAAESLASFAIEYSNEMGGVATCVARLRHYTS